MDNSTRNEVLASNLLFATLGLLVLHQVIGWIAHAVAPSQTYFHSVHFNLLTVAGLGLTTLIRGALYYGVRVGLPAAKWLVAIGFVVSLYANTHWQAGIEAGVSYARFGFDSLVLLLTNLLTLAALVLMFRKPRVASA
jgi:hypothetical protein